MASSTDALDELTKKFVAADRLLVGVSKSDWITDIDQWLRDHELV
jgi:hypothetical protein